MSSNRIRQLFISLLKKLLKNDESSMGEIRELAKLSQAELARRTGITVSHVHNVEHGRKTPSTEIAHALAKELNVPCCLLLPCGHKGRCWAYQRLKKYVLEELE